MTGTTPTPARKPESPDKVRWMLWLAKDTLAKLRKESAATGEPVAQMIRAVADARADLDPKVVQAFHAEAERQGVGLETVLREALVRAAPVRR